jgi:membrane protein required for colicin V production
MAALTGFDVIVLLLVGVASARGLWRGFVTETLSLLAWVAAAIVVRLFFEPAQALAAGWTGTEAGGSILAFVGLFFAAFVAFRLVARELGKRTRDSVVGPVDRALGFGFGAAKGIIVASLIFLGVTMFFDLVWGRDEPKPEWLTASRSYPLLKVTSQAIVVWVEERRAAEPEEKPAAGYDAKERDSLDALLDSARSR